MQVEKIRMRKGRARELWRAYKTHQHYSEPIDWEVQRTYQLIAQGRVVIRALESIKAAGLNENGLPRLAIVRADAKECFFTKILGTKFRFSAVNEWGKDHWHRHHIELPMDHFDDAKVKGRWDAACAIVPLIPIHLRPKRGLASYHVLWEAEWTKVVPRDPMLLRRIGKADLWLIVAAWDLTPVEQAVLASRMSS